MNMLSRLLLLGILLTALNAGPRLVQAQDDEPPTATCENLLANGDMEAETGWALGGGVQAASYAEGGYESETALLIESIASADISEPQWVSAIQKVALPTNVSIDLLFQYQLISENEGAATQTQIALLDEDGGLLQVLLTELTPSPEWSEVNLDLSEFAGQTVQLFFAAIAQTANDAVSLRIDNVVVCDPDSTAVETDAEVVALPATTPTNLPMSDPESTIAFSDLRIPTITLTSPIETANRTFRLPADWQVTDGATLQLDLEAAVVNNTGNRTLDTPSGARLDVALNGTAIGSIRISDFGRQLRRLEIPAAFFSGQQANAPQRLSFTFNGGLVCLDRQFIRLAIRDTSMLVAPHTIVPITPSLEALPRPIVQAAFERDQAVIVVPDQADSAELQAALTAAATLGRASDGEMDIELVPVSDLSSDQRDNSHLIFVGTTANLQQFPQAPDLAGSTAQPSDGLVTMEVSPWNPSRALLVLAGGEPGGVILAGQAFSSNTLTANEGENTAIISSVRIEPQARRVDLDRTFEVLGYDVQTISGADDEARTYEFKIPSGSTISGDSYLNLVFNHAPGIDYDRSSATVAVNGQPVGTVLLDEASTLITSMRVAIPQSAVRSGLNELSISAQIAALGNCNSATDDVGWMTIWPESTLHLPLNPVDAMIASQPSPSDYPAPFNFDAGLGETAVVLPETDSAAWNTAAQLAFQLGRQTHDEVIDLSTHFRDNLDQSVLSERNLILVGDPANLPLIETIGAERFAATSPIENLQSSVSYRLDTAANNGILETITSPFNQQRVIMGVFARSEAGLQQAGAVLNDPLLRRQINSSVALINNEQIIAAEAPAAAGLPPIALPAEGGSPIAAPAEASFQRPAWIIPTIALSAVLIVAILGYVIMSTVMRQRPKR